MQYTKKYRQSNLDAALEQNNTIFVHRYIDAVLKKFVNKDESHRCFALVTLIKSVARKGRQAELDLNCQHLVILEYAYVEILKAMLLNSCKIFPTFHDKTGTFVDGIRMMINPTTFDERKLEEYLKNYRPSTLHIMKFRNQISDRVQNIDFENEFNRTTIFQEVLVYNKDKKKFQTDGKYFYY